MNARSINIYGHYGSHNHGNEAIVRGFSNLFQDYPLFLYSWYPETDLKFNLNEVCKVRSFLKQPPKFTFQYLYARAKTQITGNSMATYLLEDFIKTSDQLFLLEAGDQYCEPSQITDFYAYVNKVLSGENTTMMLPCTIDKETIKKDAMVKDLKKYTMIFARESITHNALIEIGLGEKARFAPDPAFLMEARKCPLPEVFNSDTVGLTVGHLAQGKDTLTGNLLENVRYLIKFILRETDYNIALIPHVNTGHTLSDVEILKCFMAEFNNPQRITLIPEQRSDQLKFLISKCRFLVTLRTHASIAGYSSCVPTLVIGYSQKSKGIALDLFGSYENYVIDAHFLNEKIRLMNSFKWLVANEHNIREKLENIIVGYSEKVWDIRKEILPYLEGHDV